MVYSSFKETIPCIFLYTPELSSGSDVFLFETVCSYSQSGIPLWRNSLRRVFSDSYDHCMRPAYSPIPKLRTVNPKVTVP